LKQKIVIFGAGQAGLAAKKNLQSEYQILAFCDNDPAKANTLLENLPVIAPQNLVTTDFDLVMIASEYFEQIYQQLVDVLAIPTTRIRVLSASQIKSFHFGDNTQDRQMAERVLIALCAVFRANKIKYYIDAGTLLGIYRDDALIPWDDDLDFAIPSEAIELIIRQKTSVLMALKRASGVPWQCTEYQANQDFGLVKKGDTRCFKLAPQQATSKLPLIDLFVKYCNQSTMDYVISSRGFSMPARHMHTLAKHHFREQDIFIPSDVEDYLTAHYGDWRTPKPNWSLDDIQSSQVFSSSNTEAG
jgi:hypothetical protein